MFLNQPLSEVISLTTFDGVTLSFAGEVLRLLAYGGFGAVGQDRITRRGYKQHGQTLIDYVLQPRTIQILVWRAQACDRDVYWSNRYELHEILRPNRGGPLTFTIRRPDGTQRAIQAHANPGLAFPPTEPTQNHWGVQEAIEFICDDPSFYDPVASDTQIVSATDTDLIFPITFPIRFGVSGTQFIHNITYAGSWYAPPIFTLTGPYSYAQIAHIISGVTQATIIMSVPLAAGDQRIIDLTPGSQRIVNAGGDSRFSDLAPNSDLVTFRIKPTPEAPGGVQTIQAILGGASGASGFRVTFNTRYYAL